MVEGLNAVRDSLGKPGSAVNVANIVMELAERGHRGR
jgi:hypothetical protein